MGVNKEKTKPITKVDQKTKDTLVNLIDLKNIIIQRGTTKTNEMK